MTKQLEVHITELQSQIAFQEDAIQQLSDALYNQQQRMDGMEQQIERLKNELGKAKDGDQGLSAEIEVPPHY